MRRCSMFIVTSLHGYWFAVALCIKLRNELCFLTHAEMVLTGGALQPLGSEAVDSMFLLLLDLVALSPQSAEILVGLPKKSGHALPENLAASFGSPRYARRANSISAALVLVFCLSSRPV